jgi:ribonuclease HI
VATDGSCLGNPGPGGWAWATEDGRWGAGSHPATTNNLMELRAVYEALRAFPPDAALLIQVDSEYVMKTFTVWIEGWKARGWKTADRKPVRNQEAIKQVEALLRRRDVHWEHVRGHAGHPLNERVDALARGAATAVKSGGAVRQRSDHQDSEGRQ